MLRRLRLTCTGEAPGSIRWYCADLSMNLMELYSHPVSDADSLHNSMTIESLCISNDQKLIGWQSCISYSILLYMSQPIGLV